MEADTWMHVGCTDGDTGAYLGSADKAPVINETCESSRSCLWSRACKILMCVVLPCAGADVHVGVGADSCAHSGFGGHCGWRPLHTFSELWRPLQENLSLNSGGKGVHPRALSVPPSGARTSLRAQRARLSGQGSWRRCMEICQTSGDGSQARDSRLLVMHCTAQRI